MRRAPTDGGLGLRLVVERAASEFPDRRVVTRSPGGKHALGYGELGDRVRALASALSGLGIGPSDRVASLAWNTHRHIELILAASCVGAIVEAVNIRFRPEEIERILAASKPRALFVDVSLEHGLPHVPPGLPVIAMPDAGEDGLAYERLLGAGDPAFELPELDELRPATACYTSSTTGEPKAVEYSHRSLVLGSLVLNQPGVTPLAEADRLLVAVPFFHANAWGLPFAALLSGAELVLPGPRPASADLARLIESERVTKAAGVPTVFDDLLRVEGADLSSLEEVFCAGMQPPERLVRAYRERFGARIVHAWGMTETGFFGLVSRPPAGAAPSEEELAELDAAQGRPVPLLERRLGADGELQVRGPAVAGRYAETGDGGYTDDGWLRTGDIAVALRLRARFLRIVDRLEDTIKSGGEWIHSLVLESLVRELDGVADVAVVAVRDERWSERPYAFVVLEPGATLEPKRLFELLAARVPRWWVPDTVELVESLPRAGTGKVDKRALRRLLETERDTVRIPLRTDELERVG